MECRHELRLSSIPQPWNSNFQVKWEEPGNSQMVNSVNVGMDADNISSVEKENEKLNALSSFLCCGFHVSKLRPHEEI